MKFSVYLSFAVALALGACNSLVHRPLQEDEGDALGVAEEGVACDPVNRNLWMVRTCTSAPYGLDDCPYLWQPDYASDSAISAGFYRCGTHYAGSFLGDICTNNGGYHSSGSCSPLCRDGSTYYDGPCSAATDQTTCESRYIEDVNGYHPCVWNTNTGNCVAGPVCQ